MHVDELERLKEQVKRIPNHAYNEHLPLYYRMMEIQEEAGVDPAEMMDVYKTLFNLYLKLDWIDDAVSCGEFIVACDTKNEHGIRDIIISLADIYMRQRKDYMNAIVMYRRALQHVPLTGTQRRRVYISLGDAYRRRSCMPQALDMYTLATEVPRQVFGRFGRRGIETNEITALYRAGKALITMGKYMDGITKIQRAVRFTRLQLSRNTNLEKMLYKMLMDIGYTHEWHGNYGAALVAYEEAREVRQPLYTAAHYRIAMVLYRRLGRITPALENMKACVAIAENTEEHPHLERYYQQLNELLAAAEG